MSNPDDKTDPEGMETILVEHETNGTNGHANGTTRVPGDPEAQRVMFARLIEEQDRQGTELERKAAVDERQSRELVQHEAQFAKVNAHLARHDQRFDTIDQGQQKLAKLMTIRNAAQAAAPLLHTVLSGVVAGAIVGVAMWLALHH